MFLQNKYAIVAFVVLAVVSLGSSSKADDDTRTLVERAQQPADAPHKDADLSTGSAANCLNASSNSGSGIEKLLGSVKVTTGKYRFNQALYTGESHYGTGLGVDLELIHPQNTSVPYGLSLYGDYASANASQANSSTQSRLMHAYGISGNLYYPGSMTKILHPYIGAGLGSYRTTNTTRGSLALASQATTRTTGLGNKVMVGFEVGENLFVEMSYSNPGQSSIAGRQLSIGTRL